VRRRNEPATHRGAPLPIDLNAGIAAARDNLENKPPPESEDKKRQKANAKQWTAAEDLVCTTTNCWNIEFIRAVLEQSNGDVDAAVDYILTSGGADGTSGSSPPLSAELTLVFRSRLSS